MRSCNPVNRSGLTNALNRILTLEKLEISPEVLDSILVPVNASHKLRSL